MWTDSKKQGKFHHQHVFKVCTSNLQCSLTNSLKKQQYVLIKSQTNTHTHTHTHICNDVFLKGNPIHGHQAFSSSCTFSKCVNLKDVVFVSALVHLSAQFFATKTLFDTKRHDYIDRSGTIRPAHTLLQRVETKCFIRKIRLTKPQSVSPNVIPNSSNQDSRFQVRVRVPALDSPGGKIRNSNAEDIANDGGNLIRIKVTRPPNTCVFRQVCS